MERGAEGRLDIRSWSGRQSRGSSGGKLLSSRPLIASRFICGSSKLSAGGGGTWRVGGGRVASVGAASAAPLPKKPVDPGGGLEGGVGGLLLRVDARADPVVPKVVGMWIGARIEELLEWLLLPDILVGGMSSSKSVTLSAAVMALLLGPELVLLRRCGSV